MEILFWVWVIPAAVFAIILSLMVFCFAMMNSQSGDQVGAFLTLLLIPVVIAGSSIWPVSFPIVSYLGYRDEKRIKKVNAEWQAKHGL